MCSCVVVFLTTYSVLVNKWLVCCVILFVLSPTFVSPAGWATAFYFPLFYVNLEKLALSDSMNAGFYNLHFFYFKVFAMAFIVPGVTNLTEGIVCLPLMPLS